MLLRNPIVIATLAAMMLTAAPGQSNNSKPVDPARTLWSALKRALITEYGDQYYETHVKDTTLPLLKGVVTSAVINPGVSEIVLALSDSTTPEVTLRVHEGSTKIKTKPYVGAPIEFSGTAVDFTKNPFMLTFDVPIGDVKGLDR